MNELTTDINYNNGIVVRLYYFTIPKIIMSIQIQFARNVTRKGEKSDKNIRIDLFPNMK